VLNFRTYKIDVLVVTLASCSVLAACSGSSSYRLAGLGEQAQPPAPDDGSSGGASGGASSSGGTSGGGTSGGVTGGTSGGGTSGGSTSSGGTQVGSSTGVAGPLLVLAGNVVLGTAAGTGSIAQPINGALPVTTPVTGVVTRILTKTGQTLVDIGNGQTILAGGATNSLGKVVSLGIANNQLIGVSGGQSLIGVNLLTKTPVTGQLITAGALAGNHLAILDVTKPTAGVLGGAVGSTVAGLTGGLTGGLAGGSSPTGTLGTTVASLTGGLTGGTTTAGLGTTVSGVTGALTGGTTSAGLGGALGVGTTVGGLTSSLTGSAGGGATTTSPLGGTLGGVTSTVKGVTGGLLGGLRGH
jgi:hypothetical protein